MAAGLKNRTHKCAEIEIGNGYVLQVVRDYEKPRYALTVYVAYYRDGMHKRKINEFNDMPSAMRYMTGIIAGQIRLPI
jgi:hypothetical protein